jgi:hypothetical protein
VFLVALSAFGRTPRPDEAHATSIVRKLWEPPQAVPTGAVLEK